MYNVKYYYILIICKKQVRIEYKRKESGFMKMKRVATGLCALMMVFGGAVVPVVPIGTDTVVKCKCRFGIRFIQLYRIRR